MRVPTQVDPPLRGLRARAARGTVVNALFMGAVTSVGLVQGVLVARLLPTDAYGVWGLLMAAFMTLLVLGSVGVEDKYLQQQDDDQQRAFEVAFTLQVLLVPVLAALMLVAMPLLALLYDEPRVTAPGLALALAIPAFALQVPLWVHYRRMDFVRQRLLGSIDPLVTLVVTVALALAGLDVWALVLGAVAGSWAAGIVMALTSPLPLRLRWAPEAMRAYRGFSWPLFVGALSTVLLVQVPVVVASRTLGVTAVAGITLATTISQFAHRVEELVTQSMYPAICRVQDRRELLWEAFWKSNRLALLWAAPLGAGVALFAGDFVQFVIGEKWRFAVPLIAVYGLTAVVNQVGFNWTAFFRAVGDTRPVAAAGTVNLAAVLLIAVPLLATRGLTAFGAGLAAASLIGVAVRLRYVRSLFGGRPLVGRIARGMAPTVPAAGAVLLARALEPGGRSAGRVVAEVALFGVVTLLATGLSERGLLRESVGYLRRGAAPVPS